MGRLRKGLPFSASPVDPQLSDAGKISHRGGAQSPGGRWLRRRASAVSKPPIYVRNRPARLGSWTIAWWAEQYKRPSLKLVPPPSDHGMTWWTWHLLGGASQPPTTQVLSRWAIASRWALVWNLRRRPTSRTSD